jgi:hypothetical protein
MELVIMAKKKNSALADDGEKRLFNELFKGIDIHDMGRAYETLHVAEREVTAEEAELLHAAFRLYVARNLAWDILKNWPLTAADRLEQIRSLQKYRMKLVCKALVSKAPEAIFFYHKLPPELDPKLIRRNLEAFIEWGLSEPAGARKDNKVRDETIALMVSTILLNTKLRPTRNQASRAAGWSACSIVVEILGEHGIHVSEDLVENAWKTHAKGFKPLHARYRPDLIRDPNPQKQAGPSEK